MFFAVIAALTAILAGLLSDARLTVAAFRGLVTFLVSGIVVYVAGFLLEHLGSVWFGSRQELLEILQSMKDIHNLDQETEAEEENLGTADIQDEEIAALRLQNEHQALIIKRQSDRLMTICKANKEK